MSLPLRNCAFFMFTTAPVFAAATIRSVWRHRNAGICITSHTSPTGFACQLSCMSVSMRSPYFCFTSASICSPRSIPGPRNEVIDVRLALSNDALNIMSVPSCLFISSNFCATVSSSSALSMTHGPAMMVVLLLILSLQKYVFYSNQPNIFFKIFNFESNGYLFVGMGC